MSEQWKPVVGYEGLYEISDQGRVRSFKYGTTPRLLQAVPKKDKGHPHVCLSDRNAHRSMRTVHTLMLEAFVGPRPPGGFGLHWDDDKENNVLMNLRWGTPKDNTDDARRNGRQARGERMGSAKLTPDKIKTIRDRVSVGESQQKVADDFGISQPIVSRIVSRKIWAHV